MEIIPSELKSATCDAEEPSATSTDNASTPADTLRAPDGESFPGFPSSWYLLCTSRALDRGPVGRDLFGTRLVAWRTQTGQPIVLTGFCSHFGADLGQGEVRGDRLRCSFHQWEFGGDGRCERIPGQSEIPSSARQRAWPVAERHGFVFVFNGARPRFDLPFFFDCDPDQFLPARPFQTVLNCPWFLIGANAFDMQHFRAAHDRQLVGTFEVDVPADFARRATGSFEVAGSGIRDRITRVLAGDRVTMAITDWCGNLMFVTATFRHTTSYGMVITEPLSADRVCVRVIVFLPRSRGPFGRLWDPCRRAIRRYFIRKFLSEDAFRLNGTKYNPGGLIPCDRHLIEYFRWLAGLSEARPNADP